MSVRVSSRVWEHSSQSGDGLLLLLAMADFSDENGDCWPSQDKLSARVRCSPRWVQKLIKKLLEADEISVTQKGGGRGNPTHYRLSDAYLNPELKSPIKQETPNSVTLNAVTTKGELSDTNPELSAVKGERIVPRNHQRTTKEPPEEPPEEPPALPFDSPDFSETWEQWQKHRREIRKKLTSTAIRQQFVMFQRIGKADAIEAMQTSMRNGWTGLFEPKNGKGRMAPGEEEGIFQDWGKPTERRMSRE